MTSPISASPATSALFPASEDVRRRRIAETAQDFESSFLSVMIGQMFTDLDAEGPLSGGSAETAFRSFLSDAMAKQITRSGGIGLSGPVQAEMLRLQGLS
ncbi:MAG: rod-binding protein [Phenylobacterium sp.]